MSQLKTAFVQKIKQALDDSVFSLNDFQINLPTNALVEILFVYVPEYKISVFERTERYVDEETSGSLVSMIGKTTKYKTHEFIELRMSPGEYKSTDVEQLYGIGDLTSKIPSWCSHIQEDLRARAPQKDPLEELKKEFNEKIAGLYENPESFFEEDEVLKFNGVFEDLYLKIEGLQEEHSITKLQLEQVKKEFEEFKDSARTYPKECGLA
jgi:hypothetical protein